MEKYEDKKFLLGFTGSEFLVWNCEDRRSILEYCCGGGHRSWDFYKSNKSILFAYLKEQNLHILAADWSKLCTINIIKSFHSSEINSVAMISNQEEWIILSGGEDTTFQLSTFYTSNPEKFNTIEVLKSHLSSIRNIATCFLQEDEKGIKYYVVFSAGGRAQIILWLLTVEVQDNRIKFVNCCKKCSYYESLANDEAEMRIMDMAVVNRENKVILFAACSDGKIKVFTVNTKDLANMKLVFVEVLMQSTRCILKICQFLACNEHVLVTMSTEGKIMFWNIENLVSDLKRVLLPFSEIVAHQSGINSYSFKVVDNVCTFLTGGDDNTIVLHVFSFCKNDNGCLSLDVLHKYVNSSLHCAQITGAFITDNYFITSSVDQRVLLFKWHLNSTLCVDFIGSYNTSIPDIQGMQVHVSTNKVFYIILYGKGIEIIKAF